MLPPESVTAPIRITSPSRSHSPTELDLDPVSLSFFFSPISSKPPNLSLSPSRSPFRPRSSDRKDASPALQKETGRSEGLDNAPPSETLPATTRSAILPTDCRPARHRGRSGSTRRLSLWPLDPHGGRLTRSRSARGHRARANERGHAHARFPKVGRDLCWEWVTGRPCRVSRDVDLDAEPSRGERGPLTRDRPVAHLLTTAVKTVEDELRVLSAEANALFLHAQVHLSLADMDVDARMVRLEARVLDLEECLERVKAVRDDLASEHRSKDVRPEKGQSRLDEAVVAPRLQECFEKSTWWRGFDPFYAQKRASFLRFRNRILHLASTFAEPLVLGECWFPFEHFKFAREALMGNTRILWFRPFEAEISSTRDENEVKGLKRLCDTLVPRPAQGGKRVDLVLGQAGIEAFCLLVFGDFLLQAGLVQEVCFHGTDALSSSEATEADWRWLTSGTVFSEVFPDASPSDRTGLATLGHRWQTYATANQFTFYAHRFWSSRRSCWDMPVHARDLFDRLASADLVLFTGEDHLQRLVRPAGRGCLDRRMTFERALGPLRTHPCAPTIACVLEGCVHVSEGGTKRA